MVSFILLLAASSSMCFPAFNNTLSSQDVPAFNLTMDFLAFTGDNNLEEKNDTTFFCLLCQDNVMESRKPQPGLKTEFQSFVYFLLFMAFALLLFTVYTMYDIHVHQKK